MSITSDVRSYADAALDQGKQVLDQAQAQLTDVTGQANEFVGKLTITAKDNVADITTKASETVTDLRSQAERAINIDAIKTAIEPYLAQAREYSTAVTDRAEVLLSTVTSDPRVAKLVTTAESVGGIVIETVQDRVIKPAQSLTGRGAKPVVTPKAATTPVAPKPATTTPASTTPASSAATTTKPAAKKTTARKAPAKKASTSS